MNSSVPVPGTIPSAELRILPYGESALLVELAVPDQVEDLRNSLRSLAEPGLLRVVGAARTVLVEFESSLLSATEVSAMIRTAGRHPVDTSTTSGAVVHIEVYYDGADLAAVAAEISESTDAVIRRHSDAEYRVQFCGFSPGFGYLTGMDPILQLSRLSTPRASVPAGSVAIAGEFTSVYPRSSPGGWRLLGHTDLQLFDLHRRPPALLTPGTRVRFVPRRPGSR
jgi:KipI family sensor histidine kinase inhibitor